MEPAKLLSISLGDLPLDENSMLYWWPPIAKAIAEGALNLPVPETRIVALPESTKLWHIAMYEDCILAGGEDGDEDSGGFSCREAREIVNELARRTVSVVRESGLTYPVFIRTDQRSYKHEDPWDPVYKAEDEEDLYGKVHRLVLYASEELFVLAVNGKIDRVMRAVVARGWVEPETWVEFRDQHLRGTVYNRIEARLIVEDGRVMMGFPYYHIGGLVERFHEYVSEWDYIFEAYHENYARIFLESYPLLREYAERIGRIVPGSWSVDFMLSKNSEWYFIDMARAEESWKPPRYDKVKPEARRLLEEFVRGGGYYDVVR